MNGKSIRWILVLAVWIVLVLFLAAPARPCSTFVLAKDGRVLFGRNFDFFTGAGFLAVNPRNTAKTALIFPGPKPAQWVSAYGSVTFNQIGRDFPMGGMNEAGLVVECLWLFQAQYPAADDRAALTELQWIQYQLDTCRTVEEVLAGDSRIRILPSDTRLHFLVCDRTGRAAVVEFIEGRSVVRGPEELPVIALANNPYQDTLDALKGFRGFGGTKPIPESPGSNERFARMASALNAVGAGKGRAEVDVAFRILDAVRYEGAESPTQWKVVYDPVAGEIHFETRGGAGRRQVRLAGFNFACDATMKVLDLGNGETGDVTPAFRDYSADANRENTRRMFDQFQKAGYAKDVPAFAVALVGAYPESTRCGSGSK